MKKYNLLSGVLMGALVLAATGCSNDANEDSENVKVKITATSTIGSGVTSRVALGDDDDINTAVALNWQSDDNIAVKVGSGTAANLVYATGAGTTSATFTGEITEASGAMTAYYPTGAATATDLTSQAGTKEYAGTHNVMFARLSSFTTTPSFTFSNKTSILKFALPYPTGVTQDKVSSISATISGVNSKGTLGTDGTWGSTSADNITVTTLTAGGTTITGYAVVIPGSNVNAMKVKVAITGTDGKVSNYNMTQYTSTSATIAMGKIYNITKALVPTNFKSTYTINDLYQWDAYSHYVDGTFADNNDNWGAENEQYHFGADAIASQSCKDCPTAEQIKMYLGAGVYWDDGTVTDNGLQTFTDIANSTSHKGIWLKKKDKITGFNDGTATQSVTVTPTAITSENVALIRTSGDYFFLPLTGYILFGIVYPTGAYFWSSTTDGGVTAYALYITSKEIQMQGYLKVFGGLPWFAE